MGDLYDAFVGRLSSSPQDVLRLGFERLKPGAHTVLSSVGVPTWDVARALEDAGFDIRDAVVRLRDRSADLEAFLASLTPEQRILLGRVQNSFKTLFGHKPAAELWWLARKPFEEKTVAEQVLATGTGALNIDVCRIKTNESLMGGAYSGGVRPNSAMGCTGQAGGTSSMLEAGGGRLPPSEFQQPSGRWPANLTLQHGPGCERVGTKNVRSSTEGKGALATTFGSFNDDNWKPLYHSDEHPWLSKDGLETIEAWECAPGCPVRSLDEQSGHLHARGNTTPTKQDGTNCPIPWGAGRLPGPVNPSDEGGASRFFNTFASDGDFLNHILRLIVPPGGRVYDPFGLLPGGV